MFNIFDVCLWDINEKDYSKIKFEVTFKNIEITIPNKKFSEEINDFLKLILFLNKDFLSFSDSKQKRKVNTYQICVDSAKTDGTIIECTPAIQRVRALVYSTLDSIEHFKNKTKVLLNLKQFLSEEALKNSLNIFISITLTKKDISKSLIVSDTFMC